MYSHNMNRNKYEVDSRGGSEGQWLLHTLNWLELVISGSSVTVCLFAD